MAQKKSQCVDNKKVEKEYEEELYVGTAESEHIEMY